MLTCIALGFTRLAFSSVNHILAATAAQISWSELGHSPAELIELPSRSNNIVHLSWEKSISHFKHSKIIHS